MGIFGDVAANTVLNGLKDVGALNIGLGGTAPTRVSIGTSPEVPALLFDATNENAEMSIVIPTDFDFTQDPTFALLCNLSNVQNNLDSLDWTMNYNVSRAGETGQGLDKTSTPVTWSTSITTALGLAVNDQYISVVTLDRTDATNPIASGATQIGIEIHLTNIVDVVAIKVSAAQFAYKKLF